MEWKGGNKSLDVGPTELASVMAERTCVLKRRAIIDSRNYLQLLLAEAGGAVSADSIISSFRSDGHSIILYRRPSGETRRYVKIEFTGRIIFQRT